MSLELPRPRVEDGALIARAVYIDRFGNVQLGVEHERARRHRAQARPRGRLELGTQTKHEAHFALTFADVAPDELLVYEDAQRRLAVAVSHGSAATRLGISVDDELRITPK